ncbi:hypothetical protein RJT34_07571 [Clitoria ternatea]|uniref:Uncharacterized protein n=1 Tax=Clitoria ternatea TaxID=43366 RepID=A0AAN9K599_CLITE
MAKADALVSTINVLEKSGRANIGVVVMCCFNCVNAFEASELQTNLVEQTKSVSGKGKAACIRRGLVSFSLDSMSLAWYSVTDPYCRSLNNFA